MYHLLNFLPLEWKGEKLKFYNFKSVGTERKWLEVTYIVYINIIKLLHLFNDFHFQVSHKKILSCIWIWGTVTIIEPRKLCGNQDEGVKKVANCIPT